MIKVSKLKQSPRNPRKISQPALERLAKSIEQDPEFMRLRPIVYDDAGIILGGNQRHRAIRDVLKMKEIPDEWAVRANNLTSEQRRRFQLVDNAPAGMAGDWDLDLLSTDWDVPELEDLGFDLGMFDGLDLGGDGGAGETDAEPQIDRAAELNKEWQVKPGDLWRVGDHRLLCGDSTKVEDVERLMGGVGAAVCLTDPPYGLADTKSEKNKYNQHDDTKEELVKIISGFLPIAQSIAPVLVLTPGTTNHRMYPTPTWTMAWFVPAGTGVGPWGFCCWQPILCYGKDPKLTKGKGSHPDAIVHTETAEKLGHPCPKPVNFWQWLTERTTESGEVVYDPFAGSGTSLVACQNLSRKCRGIETSPDYCAVILQRMADAFPELDIERIEATNA